MTGGKGVINCMKFVCKNRRLNRDVPAFALMISYSHLFISQRYNNGVLPYYL